MKCPLRDDHIDKFFSQIDIGLLDGLGNEFPQPIIRRSPVQRRARVYGCGEPIFTGKFRTLPGPRFWLPIYLVLDCGSFLPYLAANTAIPLAAIWLGELPDQTANATLLKVLGCFVFFFLDAQEARLPDTWALS